MRGHDACLPIMRSRGCSGRSRKLVSPDHHQRCRQRPRLSCEGHETAEEAKTAAAKEVVYPREHRRQCCVCRGVGQARLGLSVHQLSSTRSSAAVVSPERVSAFLRKSQLCCDGDFASHRLSAAGWAAPEMGWGRKASEKGKRSTETGRRTGE